MMLRTLFTGLRQCLPQGAHFCLVVRGSSPPRIVSTIVRTQGAFDVCRFWRRWLRPANVDLCGTLAPNAGYTVCRINGSVCVPLENLTEGCGALADPKP